MTSNRYIAQLSMLLLLVLVMPAEYATANVPVRVSVKFIVDSDGNRPPSGNFNTTAEVNAETDAGNEIVAARLSELRIQVTEIIDLPTSLSTYSTISVNSTNRDQIRSLAMASPTTWRWRTNAVNVYVTGGSGSAISKFPPDNDIILFGQNCGNTPSCLLHELGHSLNLLHTHQSGGADGCSDTLADNDAWSTKDQMAQANYGLNYNQLTSTQQTNVDNTWSNFMSYHVDLPQDRFTPCQKDRTSAQASTDQTWLLAQRPLYVHPANALVCSILGTCNGTWVSPFPSFQAALNSGITNRAVVLEQGNYTITQAGGINSNIDIVTRNGTSRIDRGVLLYELPVDLGNSQNAQVSAAVKAAQSEATRARRALQQAKERAAEPSANNPGQIMKQALLEHMESRKNIIQHYLQAEVHADGNEKLSIQKELAERYQEMEDYPQCHKYYKRVANNTDQPVLANVMNRKAEQCKAKISQSADKPTATPELEEAP